MKIISLFALLFAMPAGAWEPVAHRAAAAIAQRRLKPSTLQAVQVLLGKDPSGRQLELEDVAGCADGFAHDAGFRCASAFALEGQPAASIPWHFINIPISAKNPAPKDYCPSDKGCLWSRIGAELTVLRNGAATANSKRTALVLLVHFVGDAHQPLHCADDQDFGGNKKTVDVEYKDQRLNLHKVWDEALMNPTESDWRLPSETLAATANGLYSELEMELGALDPKIIADWTQGDLATRAIFESWSIAKEKIYPRYALDHGSIGNERHGGIGEDYRKLMQPIARKRIEMAGVRLAELLNRTLGS